MRPALAPPEFVALAALLVSIVALSTDIMLPALGAIGADLAVRHANDAQLVVSTLFAGLAIGQLLAGPLSDRFGRRPVIHAGFALFALGCLLSARATSLEAMLAGRALQGLGAAAPRIVILAIVRDGYAGRDMARILSIVMAVFIVVPTVAPALGQAILLVASWRAAFGVLLGVAVVGWAWFAVRQPETLAPANRRALSAGGIAEGLRAFAAERAAVGYTVATGWSFGAFAGYLGSAQQVFQQTYATGARFALWFAVASLAIGGASLANAALVRRFGMRAPTGVALATMAAASTSFLVVALAADGVPPFAAFMVWLLIVMACMGVLFGNLNALAMEPLGRVAGLGAALVGSLSTLMALPFAWAVGRAYDGGVGALVGGFAVLGAAAFATACATERGLPWRAREAVGAV